MMFSSSRTSGASRLVTACTALAALAALLLPAAPQASAQFIAQPSRHHHARPQSLPATSQPGPAVNPTPVVTPEGTWTPLTNTLNENVGLMLLLTDGTVAATSNNDNNTWHRLTPDSKGSYANGTWSNMPSMTYQRLYVQSQILQNGKLFVSGGEYGNAPNGSAELYDPIANTWTLLPTPESLDASLNFVDGESILLPNGKILAYAVLGSLCPALGASAVIYDPVANSWAAAACPLKNQDESSWVKLPDDSILTLDLYSTTSERYFPSTGKWVADAVPPAYIFNDGGELGGAFLLPNGKVLYIGGTNQTLLYTPSGGSTPGTWTQGPTFPNEAGVPVGANDAPAAPMTNGNILMAVSGYVSPCDYCGPSYFFVYDYLTNTIQPIVAPDGTASNPYPGFVLGMLDLPDGTVLSADNSAQLYVFKPTGSQIQAGEPVLNSVVKNVDGSYLLTGTGFTGISAGADYGDEDQNYSNYPVVRLTDSSANVYYARTTNWSSTGVATGNQIITTNMTVPAGLPHGLYTLAVTANGFSSDITLPSSSFCYLCTVVTPTITPPGGSFASSQQVTMSDSTVGAAIYFTLDGSTPTAASHFYSTGFTVGTSETVKAIAILDGVSSAVNSATFTITGLLGSTTALSVAPGTILTTQSSTLTATVAPLTGTNTLTGMVSFFDVSTASPVALGTVNLANGKAPLTISNLSSGIHTLAANYLGDGTTYAGSLSTSATLTVNLAPQTITFGALANVTNGVSPITLTATATSGLAVTYTVTGPASVSGSILTITGPGTVAVTAAQAGNAVYAVAPVVVQSFTVASSTGTSTTTVATISSNSFVSASPAIVNVHVSCNSACGSVDFREDGGEWAVVGLDGNGNFSAPTSYMPNQTVGPHTVTISYLGNAQYTSSTSNTLSFNIVTTGATASVTTASIDSTSFTMAQPATVSAHVNCNTACGNVDFREDGAEWGTVPLDANGNFNAATNGMPNQTAGPHTVTVFYQGNNKYSASTSNTVSFTIATSGATATITTATITSNSFTAAQPATVSVHVNCNTSCGNVDFREDGVEWGTVAIDANGNFSAPTSYMPNQAVGPHTATILYLGNAKYSASTSNTLNFNIVSGGSTATVTTAAITSNSFAAAQPAMVSVHVNCNTSCGSVDFREDGGEWGTVGLDANGNFVAATSYMPNQSVGPHTVTISYLGNAQYSASTSNTLSFSIVASGSNASITTATITSKSFAASQPAAVTVHVNCNTACGNVDFREDGAEWGTVSLDANGNFTATTNGTPNQTVGIHSVTIFYLGSAQYGTSTSNTLTYTITGN